MSKDKSLKHRAICPECGKPFDTQKNYGGLIYGVLVCFDCYNKQPYKKYIKTI